jgi:hypothetical protein
MNSPLNLSRSKFQTGCVFTFVVGTFLSLVSANAEVLASYRAPENPTSASEGARWSAAGRASAGTAVEQPETAWRIAPTEGNSLNYALVDPESILKSAFTTGWKYTARVRLDPTVASPIDRFVASLGVENAEKKEAFVMSVRSAGDTGELFVEINKKTVPLPNLATDDFHTYVMTYDPSSSSVQLTVDGEAVSETFPSAPTDRWFLRWGHSSITPRGAAEWALVTFELMPPSLP